MTIIRQTKTHGDSTAIFKYPFQRPNRVIILLSILAHFTIHGSFYVLAIVPENRNLATNRGNLPTDQERPREGYYAAPRSSNKGNNNGNDDNNGIIQIIESEVWDASENVWKGAERGNRWTNEKGQISPSPAEVFPPEGWQFLGDWKIVVSSNSNSNGAGIGGSGGGDSQGWEYQFQYLQPPRRKRIWLRSLTPTNLPPIRQPGSQTSRIVPKPSAPIESAGTRTKVKKLQRTSRFVRTIKQIRDDWNYKGLGLNIYKSFVFPSSVGLAIRLPLSINFDTFDRNPSWPIISSSAAVFYPPMMGGFLSTSVHVEWVKWVVKNSLGLIPRSFFWMLYRVILPTLWAIASLMLFPLKGLFNLPPRPTQIPNGSWWTGSIAKPQYNSEMQERLGCSISYRWSKKRGYEFRVSYWHSYLPTLLVYQQFLSQLEERFKGTFKSGGSKTLSPSASSALSSSSSLRAKNNWWRKHTASLGVSTVGPIPDTPPIGCSANLSLSGLYWGARDVMSKSSISTSTITNAAGSRTNSVVTTAISGPSDDNHFSERDKDQEDHTMIASTEVRTASTQKTSSPS